MQTTPETAAAAAEPRAPRPVDVVVGIPLGPGELPGSTTARAIVEEVGERFRSRRASVLLLTRRHAHAEVEALSAAEAARPAAAGEPERPPPPAGAFAGPESALHALLAAAHRLGATASILMAPERHDPSADWEGRVVQPILEEGYDLVRPVYVRGKLDATLETAIVYPLTRALYGRRLLQPLRAEVALSRRLAEALLADPEWQTDPAQAGADAWVVAKALTGGFRVAQALLGRAPPRAADPGEDLGDTLARVVGLLFRQMQRHAAAWQRIAGSAPVATFGEGGVVEAGANVPTAARMVAAFLLGWQDLRELWGIVLPPATLLALQRVTRQPASTFRLDDALWARIVYDFALAWHMRLMERSQMLRSMAPIYLAWLAGWANEIRDLDGPATEARLERLCLAFEEAKPYLISRWRWPDRWNP